jgi:serine 3-dehydrogenase (NADP+)
MGKLDGKVAIVTGASSGMGWATALAFAREGAKLSLVARRQGLLDDLAGLIADQGGDVLTKAADVSNQSEIEAAVKATVERFGRVDVLANIAGINTSNHELAAVTHDDWNLTLAINLTGAFNCMKAVLPTMRRQRDGLIILISSVSGLWGDTSGAAYQASKHGLTGLAQATMIEERLNGIRVTVIYPGLCDTPILSTRAVPDSPEKLAKMMRPEDIADACIFAAGLPPRTYISHLVMMPGVLQCAGDAVGY